MSRNNQVFFSYLSYVLYLNVFSAIVHCRPILRYPLTGSYKCIGGDVTIVVDNQADMLRNESQFMRGSTSWLEVCVLSIGLGLWKTMNCISKYDGLFRTTTGTIVLSNLHAFISYYRRTVTYIETDFTNSFWLDFKKLRHMSNLDRLPKRNYTKHTVLRSKYSDTWKEVPMISESWHHMTFDHRFD